MASPISAYDALVDDLLSHACADDDASMEATKATPLDLVLDGDVDALQALFLKQQKEPNAGVTEKVEFHVNARSPTAGRSLLHEACAEGKLEIVKFLLEKTDADLMLRTMLGRSTPLHIAVTCNHRAIVFLLLSYGADALSRDRFGSSPMHYVRSLSVAKLLIQYGGYVLDYNLKRKNALETVLMLAESGDIEDNATWREFQKFLKRQAELEYKAKLAKLRDLKTQTKAQKVALKEMKKLSAVKRKKQSI